MPGELRGIVALVTRPAGQGEALCAAIRARGGRAVAVPLLGIEPLGERATFPARLQHPLHEYDLAVFVSTNAVAAALAALERTGQRWPPGLVCIAVGQATRAALERAGLPAAGGEGEAMNSEELLAHPLLASPRGLRVLLVKGEGGRDLIATTLRARGAAVEACPLYRRVDAAPAPADFGSMLRAEGINTLLANSVETLERLLGLLAGVPAGTIPREGTCFVVPGERVADAARGRVPGRLVVARNASDAAMLEALAGIAGAAGEQTETA